MDETDTSAVEQTREGLVSSFIGILIRPTETITRILDRPSDPWVVPLILMTLVSSLFKEVSIEDFRDLHELGGPVVGVLFVLGVFLLASIVIFVLFLALSGIATVAGKYLLGGEGTFRRVLSAMTWGLAPAVAAVVYRVPAAFLRAGSEQVRVTGLGEGSVVWDRGLLSGDNWILSLVFALLELGFFLWTVVLTSKTLGVAHRFTAWHGLACLVLSWLSPLVLVLAAFLTLLST